jgi:enoyl-CoA hydratase
VEPPQASQVLLSQRHGHVLQLTLNRPEKLNALNPALQAAITHAFQQAAQDPAVRAIVLTGAGRAFCAGLDLSDFDKSFHRKDRDGKTLSAFKAIEATPQPVIAAINGYAVTGGFEIALACDILLASPAAKFGDTHAQVGVMPGAGLSQKLSRLIGLPRAMAVSLAGEFITGEQAVQYGLVSQLVPAERLLPEALRLAQRVAEADPEIIRRLKRLMKDGAGLSLAGGMALEQLEFNAWTSAGKVGDVAQRRGSVMQRSRDRAASDT